MQSGSRFSVIRCGKTRRPIAIDLNGFDVRARSAKRISHANAASLLLVLEPGENTAILLNWNFIEENHSITRSNSMRTAAPLLG
jgi:hypothetical protein